MKTIVGASNWMIEVNLTTGRVIDFQVDENDRRKYLGGQGLGLKLLYDRMDRGVDPLGEKNYLALVMGVLMGSGVPCSEYFSVVTKSPHTGMMQGSFCEGPFGMACKTAGYGGLLITGKAPAPAAIQMDENGARIIDPSVIQDLDSDAAVRGGIHPNSAIGVLSIDLLDDYKAPFDSPGGDGWVAVMGAKNLTAVVARGKAYKIVPADPKRFAKAVHRIFGYVIYNRTNGDDVHPFEEGEGGHADIDGEALSDPRFRDSGHSSGLEMSPGVPGGGALKPAPGLNPEACRRCSARLGPASMPAGLNPSTFRAKAVGTIFIENRSTLIHALSICPLTSHACALEPLFIKHAPDVFLRLAMRYWPTIAVRRNVSIYAKLWRSVTGLRLNQRQMLKAGARVRVLERLMNTGEGFSRKDDTLSGYSQFVGGQGDAGAADRQPMLSAYYRLRGYDLRGIPTEKTLKRLGIEPKWDLNGDRRLADFKILSPGGKPFKNAYLSIMFKVVGRSIQAAARVDSQMQRAFVTIPDRFTFMLTVAPDGPGIIVGKDQGGKVRYLGGRPRGRHIDLKLTIKNIEAAMSLFTARESPAMAVARKRLRVDGDPAAACDMIRILELAAVLLLPRSLATRVVRRYPPWMSFQRSVNRLLIYLRTALGI